MIKKSTGSRGQDWANVSFKTSWNTWQTHEARFRCMYLDFTKCVPCSSELVLSLQFFFPCYSAAPRGCKVLVDCAMTDTEGWHINFNTLYSILNSINTTTSVISLWISKDLMTEYICSIHQSIMMNFLNCFAVSSFGDDSARLDVASITLHLLLYVQFYYY